MANELDATSPVLGWFREAAAPILDRRRLLGLATGAGATAAAANLGLRAAPSLAATRQELALPLPLPLSSHTWLLDSPDALRPKAPGAATETELDEILDLQARRTDATSELVARWGGRPAVIPWLELGTQLSDEYAPSALHDTRAHAHLRAAMHDAVVAVLDAQAVHARQAPSLSDERITVLGDAATEESAFPSLHAAVAGAASTVLADLFPEASSDGFAALADEAATSRLWAGAAYRSDVEAGLKLGREIGELAVERGRADGSDAEWDGSGQPSGDGFYEPTPPDAIPPFGVLAGSWKTWVLPSGDVFRPAPFPEYGSPAWQAELAAVQAATSRRTLAQERIIDYWLSKGPHGFYTEYARALIDRGRLSEAEASGVLAMVSVAIFDTFVAVWDAKYHYWIARPITVDPGLNMYINTPPYPSYPGGFGAGCNAGATVLCAAFPDAEADLLATALEGAAQRCWSGIHYVLDDDTALLMGGQVGRLVADHVRNGGGEDAG